MAQLLAPAHTAAAAAMERVMRWQPKLLRLEAATAAGCGHPCCCSCSATLHRSSSTSSTSEAWTAWPSGHWISMPLGSFLASSCKVHEELMGLSDTHRSPEASGLEGVGHLEGVHLVSQLH
jgi:hypothetical protein